MTGFLTFNELGVTGRAVYTAEGDPNNLLVMREFRSSQEAHSFFENPHNREVMQYAGLDVGSLRLELYDPAGGPSMQIRGEARLVPGRGGSGPGSERSASVPSG